MNFLDAFERTVRVHGGDTAIVADDGRTFTYGEFDRRSTQLTNGLRERVGDGPVAVLTKNCPAAAEAMIAGHKRGTPTVQLPFRGKPGELARMLEVADAEALLFDDANADTALEVLESGPADVGIHAGDRDLTAPGVEGYDAVRADAADEMPEALPADGKTSIFFTSGTTSRPKAVAFEGNQMWIGAYQVVMEHGIDETDLGVVTTPWYHMVTSDAWLYPHWLAGATTYFIEDFEPATVLEAVERQRATGLLAVPTQLNLLADEQEDAETPADTDSLEYVRTGGAVVTETLVERAHEFVTDHLYNTYGMTEAGPDLTFAHPTVQDEHPGTIGKESFSWEIRVVETVSLSETPDPEATVEQGEQGEIIARGPGVPDGYIDNPEAEERGFFGEWLRTRDVAEVDDDGYLYIVDRVDNMFISGGENIYPAEVQRTLESHAAVEEALVFGQDHETWGQMVTAIVVADGVSEADLEAYCTEETDMADFKRPREYAVRDEPLPRTDTGTVRRDEAIDEHF